MSLSFSHITKDDLLIPQVIIILHIDTSSFHLILSHLRTSLSSHNISYLEQPSKVRSLAVRVPVIAIAILLVVHLLRVLLCFVLRFLPVRLSAIIPSSNYPSSVIDRATTPPPSSKK